MDRDNCNHYIVRWEEVWNTQYYHLYCIDCGKWIEKQESKKPSTLNNIRNPFYKRSMDEVYKELNDDE